VQWIKLFGFVESFFRNNAVAGWLHPKIDNAVRERRTAKTTTVSTRCLVTLVCVVLCHDVEQSI
jgi:hypothetical protein